MCSEIFVVEKEGIDRERIVTDKYNILNEFFCPICCCLLWKPRSCVSCQNLFCHQCIQTWLNVNSTDCPLCRCPYEEKRAPPYVQSLLTHFSIRCRNSSIGCTEILPYDLLEKHEIFECQFLTKKCQMCGQVVFATDIDYHKTMCKPTVRHCSLCESFIQIELFEHHIDECFEQYSNPYEEVVQEWFMHLDSQNEEIGTSRIDLVGSEVLNRTRQQHYFIRFWAIVQLILFNLSMTHLILLNLFSLGIESLEHVLLHSFLCLQRWTRSSQYQAFIFIIVLSIILNYSLFYLLESIDDMYILVFIIITSIVWT
jgi:hypothetical protein